MIDSLHPSAKLAVRRFQTQVPRFRDEFVQKLEEIMQELARRGILRSGALIQQVQRACQNEMRRRTFTARHCVLEGLESDWSPNESEIESAFSQCFQATDCRMFYHTDIEAAMGNAIATSGVVRGQDAANALFLSIAHVQVDAHDESTTALRAAARKRRADTGVRDQHNYYAPVGAVQTGQQNVAYVTQQMIGGDLKALVESLSALRQHTAGDARATATTILANEAINEVQARNNFTSKAKSLIEGIGATVKTIGEAVPAYEALRLAAGTFGVILPPLTAG